MPGFRLCEDDKKSINAKYLCTYCGEALRDPVQTIACGHRYCKTCLDTITSDPKNSNCMEDGTPIKKDQVFPDKFAGREILDFVVHCVNFQDGCKWRGELRNLEAHEVTCEYVKIPCVHSECGTLVTRAELANHLQTQCAYRQQDCSYCGTQAIAAYMQDHQRNQCPAYPIKCSHCGKDGILRSEMSGHLSAATGDCSVVEIACPFAEFGCRESKPTKLQNAKKHIKENSVVHLTILLQVVAQMSSAISHLMNESRTSGRHNGVITSLQQMVEKSIAQVEKLITDTNSLTQKVSEHNTRLRKLETSHASSNNSGAWEGASNVTGMVETTRRVNNLDAKTADIELLMIESNRALEDLKRQVAFLTRRLDTSQETVLRLERCVESQDHMLALRNVALADLEEYIRQQEVSSYNGVLLWKINNFARRKMDAMSGKQASIYSAAFYSSRHGYKMCARIYLNGDGMGKGTHISLFFVVMRGQYDALLCWPFRQKVTMMMLDQDNIEHVIDAFRPDPNSSSFQKPAREMNIASGCPLFCPLSDLDKHAYIRDDTMFLKIIVDTSDI